jgi:uncharacterized protein DUF5947
MNTEPRDDNPALTALASLRRFARPRPVREQCELCAVPLAPEHAHLVEVSSRRLLCACDACGVLFSGQSASRFRRVPRDVYYLPDFRLGDAAWGSLRLPVNLAFFLHSTPANAVVAFYPSPAGATEATVPSDAWQALVNDNPLLHRFEPDVEALLVNRVGAARDCYRVGIDECYRLVGLVRKHWRGFSGGPAVWGEVAQFFAGLKERSAHA